MDGSRKHGRTPLYYAIDKWSLNHYEHIICVSEDLFDSVKTLGVASSQLSLVFNAIDHEAFVRSISIADAKQKLGWPVNRLLIVRWDDCLREKGFHLLVDVVERARS